MTERRKLSTMNAKSKMKINDPEIDIIVVHNAVVINAAYNITRLIGFSPTIFPRIKN